MAISINDLSSTVSVLDSGLGLSVLAHGPSMYAEADQRFDGFTGCSLIARHSFDSDWPTWEIHPQGDELVCLLAGAADLVLYCDDGSEQSVHLDQPGSYIVVPRNTWHTARLNQPTTMLFITPGEGTRNVALDEFPPLG
jgi:hypothetical protein